MQNYLICTFIVYTPVWELEAHRVWAVGAHDGPAQPTMMFSAEKRRVLK